MPTIRCACCGATFPVRSLNGRRLGTSPDGHGVYACPACETSLAPDPFAYLDWLHRRARGNNDPDTPFEAGALPRM